MEINNEVDANIVIEVYQQRLAMKEKEIVMLSSLLQQAYRELAAYKEGPPVLERAE